MSKFPVPVSGEKIPHGWFANLVRFVNSLTLHGDGRYTMVSRNESGTTVTLTPAVKDAIERSGGTPPGSGGSSCIPNYGAGESVTPGTAYTINTPGWIIGCVGGMITASEGDYFISWSLGLSIQSSYTIALADFRSSHGGADTRTAFVSILLPACSFTVSYTNRGYTPICYLSAYPIL